MCYVAQLFSKPIAYVIAKPIDLITSGAFVFLALCAQITKTISRIYMISQAEFMAVRLSVRVITNTFMRERV